LRATTALPFVPTMVIEIIPAPSRKAFREDHPTA